MRTVSHIVFVAVLNGLLAGCSGTPAGTPIVIYVTPSPAPGATATTQPTAAPPATPTRAPTPKPTPKPTQADSDAEKGDPLMFTWADNGYVTAQILLPITNTGGTWIELLEYDSQWTIYDPSGGVLETGSFDAGAPDVIDVGGEAYLVGEWFGDDHHESDFATVEADGYFREIDEPAAVLIAGNVTTRRHTFGGVEVVGEIGNLGTEDVDNADVVALFFDVNGDLLGYAQGYIENIAAGGTRAFQIDSSFAEIKLSDVDSTEVYASPW